MSTKQIDRQTYRDLARPNDLYGQQTDRQLTETAVIYRQKDRWTELQTQIDRWTYRDRLTDRHAYTDLHRHSQTYRDIDRFSDTQTNLQILFLQLVADLMTHVL